jgi:hypothetical protein
MKMLIGGDTGDLIGNRTDSVCESTEKRICHYLCEKIIYQPEFKLPNLHQKHLIQLAR